MSTNQLATQISKDEKQKVAYALNLCAVSISQIIDSKDIIVLKQERESILNNLNLQNFVKHPALFDVLKQILDTVTYLEIQAGNLSFVEKEYQQKLKNAIWHAVPSPGALLAGGSPVSLAIAVAAQIGTGYMNYRRNKSQYALDKEKREWELKRHELEQLYGLRAQLFETAWKLSDDYDFDDKFRLTEKQLSRYSEALLEEDPLKRHERLDVMSGNFAAFPPFWYYKGNAAMEVSRDKRPQYSAFSASYKTEAIEAYNAFHKSYFEFLREDVIAASCCIEHISLLSSNDQLAEDLLQRALRLAGDNYDVLQQSVFVNLQLKKFDEVISPLREMFVNGYNVVLNGSLLSQIYFMRSDKTAFEKLRAIAEKDDIPLSWSDNAKLSEEELVAAGRSKTAGKRPQGLGISGDAAEKNLVDDYKSKIADAYVRMAQKIVFILSAKKSSVVPDAIFHNFKGVANSLKKYIGGNGELDELFNTVEEKLRRAISSANNEAIEDFFSAARQVETKLRSAGFSMQILDDAKTLIDKMEGVSKS
jgi:hypothetical protein